jgi:hypothetical protein
MRASPPAEAAGSPDPVDAVRAATAVHSTRSAVAASSAASSAAASQRWQWRVTLLFAVLILIPSGYGFIGKFVELVNLFRHEAGGEFAVAPILNYLLASLGFALLEHEQLLDRGTEENRR